VVGIVLGFPNNSRRVPKFFSTAAEFARLFGSAVLLVNVVPTRPRRAFTTIFHGPPGVREVRLSRTWLGLP